MNINTETNDIIKMTVSKIWHAYKTYKLRCKVFDVFQKLPYDLQQKIIHHALEPICIKQENDIIKNIVYKKINNFMDDMVNPLNITYYSSPNVRAFLTESEQSNFVYISRLVCKYYPILNYKNLKMFFYVNLCLHNNYCIHNLDNIINSGWEDIAECFRENRLAYKKIIPTPFFEHIDTV
jgi:hypothetical protein